jgi:hypothetical protein
MPLVYDFSFQERESVEFLQNVKQSKCSRYKNNQYGSRAENQPNTGLDFPNRSATKSLEVLSFSKVFFLDFLCNFAILKKIK